MPKHPPKYCLHKASGRAKVRIDGKDHYLGVYDSPESHERYNKLISKWLTDTLNVDRECLSIARLAVMYVEFARSFYLKNGEVTSEVYLIQMALKPLVKKFGRENSGHFGPRKLKSVREDMIGQNWARTTINAAVQRITRMLRWATENEFLDASVFQACRAITGLRRGRCKARETAPIEPVPRANIDAVELFVSRQVWSMIQLQLWTGMRPGEVCTLRLCDVDTSGTVWEYQPQTHKTEHHGRQRRIFIGPRGQAVLKPYLENTTEGYVFRPVDAEQARNGLRRAGRKSPMTPSQAARQANADPRGSAGERYRRDSYTKAIARACKLAKVPAWSPNQLRHNAATELRKRFGLEGTRTVLGHSNADMTAVYAELDFEAARRIMESAG